jgi:hypothetical protein
MDFKLYSRVLWRFKLLVALGFVIAVALAVLATVRVTPHGVTYRQSQLWSSGARLLVTQQGFPEGRLFAQTPVTVGQAPPAADSSARKGIPVADPNRFNALAILYADLATSDPVRALMSRGPSVPGQILATPLRDDQSGTLLPLIDITAISITPQSAIALAQRNVSALKTYLEARQRANGVPEADRAVVQTLVEPKGAKLFRPRAKTMPIVVFLAVMFATIALTFILENVRPRVRKQGQPVEAELRRTA